MTEIHFQSAVEIAAAIRAKRVSAVEVLEHFLSRVERYNQALNAIIWIDPDRARVRAREADAAIAKGEVWGPLHGVPMTIKDSFNVAGAPTTWGRPELADNVAEHDALSVARLKRAGVVLFGKTNIPIHLADWQSFNAIYGTSNNPWDLTRTPGGSSGGSAAALAAGLTGLDAGSDIGASIRNPAHYCGVFGHKPTYGAVSPHGHALPGMVTETDISVVGPMARSAQDLAVALNAMAGPSALDGVGWRLELPPPRMTSFKGLRVAVKLSDPCCEVDDEYAQCLQQLANTIASEGAHVKVDVEPKLDTRRAHRVYITLLRAATSGRMPQQEVERWQHYVSHSADDDASYVAMMARGNTLSHRDWLALNNERHQLRQIWHEFFRDWDVLLCPAAASAAWPHDQVGERHDRTITVNAHQVPTTDQMFWAGYSGSVYLPSTVAPIGRTRDGLPLGVQIIGGHLQDHTCIAFARALSNTIGGFEPPPGYD